MELAKHKRANSFRGRVVLLFIATPDFRYRLGREARVFVRLKGEECKILDRINWSRTRSPRLQYFSFFFFPSAV